VPIDVGERRLVAMIAQDPEAASWLIAWFGDEGWIPDAPHDRLHLFNAPSNPDIVAGIWLCDRLEIRPGIFIIASGQIEVRGQAPEEFPPLPSAFAKRFTLHRVQTWTMFE
jgi:hypothetical protein